MTTLAAFLPELQHLQERLFRLQRAQMAAEYVLPPRIGGREN